MGFSFVCAFFIFGLEILVEARCNQFFGPIGSSWGGSECIWLRKYSKHQWATRLSNSYIETFSKHRHTCEDSATYCLYQCMLESHEIEDGKLGLMLQLKR